MVSSRPATLLRLYLAHFLPVSPRFLRVFTVSTRRFQRAASRNPGPRNSRHDPTRARLRFRPSAPVGRITWRWRLMVAAVSMAVGVDAEPRSRHHNPRKNSTASLGSRQVCTWRCGTCSGGAGAGAGAPRSGGRSCCRTNFHRRLTARTCAHPQLTSAVMDSARDSQKVAESGDRTAGGQRWLRISISSLAGCRRRRIARSRKHRAGWARTCR